MKSLVVDDACRAGTHIGPVVDQRQLEQDLSYIRLGQDEGAKLVAGGELLSRDMPGFYLFPALFAEVDNRMRIAREELFGPVATVIRARNYENALEIANDTSFGLSAGICTSSLKYASHFKRNAQAGMIMVNCQPRGWTTTFRSAAVRARPTDRANRADMPPSSTRQSRRPIPSAATSDQVPLPEDTAQPECAWRILVSDDGHVSFVGGL